jgi:aminoglycoside 6'-N-acetyltransferase
MDFVWSSVHRVFPVCSFCGERPVVAWFEGPGFTTAVDSADKVRSEEAWVACSACARLVEADDREALVRRGAQRSGSQPDHELEMLMTRAHQEDLFWKPRSPDVVLRVPVAPLRGGLTVVRPATLDDADLLVGWHADPDVARYWDGQTYTREEMLRSLARPDVDSYIVEDAGDPVGYLQAWFALDLPDEAGLDMFLIPGARDRGLGPDAARTLAGWLLSTGGRHRITVDPYLTNERAVRAWTKVGFRPGEEREPDEEHTEPWLLMTLVSDGLAGPV